MNDDLPIPVAITGMGAVTAAGAGVEAYWQALLCGEQLAQQVKDWDVEGFGCSRAARIPSPVLEQVLSAAPMTVDPTAALFLEAQREAVQQAGMPDLCGSRVGLYLGTSTGGLDRWIPYHRAAVHEDVLPWGSADTGYSAPARQVAHLLGIEGPVLTVSTACSSATAALGMALDDIRHGVVDMALVGGADRVDRFVHAGFDLLGALTAQTMNPFGTGRTGLILGDGAGALILEGLPHARARGVRVLAELAGAGSAADANHMTGPDREGRGVERALQMAIDDAALLVDDVDLVCAHATATPYNDAMEARALSRLFGHRRPLPMAVGYKPVTGHTLGACGVLEAIACVQIITNGTVPASAGAGPQDPDCPFPLLRGEPLRQPVGVAVSCNSAFAGNNAAVVVRALELF